jgi:hypothetical protein
MSAVLTETTYGTFVFPHGDTLIDYPTFWCERYGFEIVDTGGGCTSWWRDFVLADGMPVTLIATDIDGTSHAVEPGEPVMMGIYPRGQECCEAIALWIQSGAGLPPEMCA